MEEASSSSQGPEGVTEERISIESLIFTAESAKKWCELQTMFHVPVWIYQADPDAYTPLLVSIGPFHHVGPNFCRHEGDDKDKKINLQAMEAQKQVFMLRLLDSVVHGEEADNLRREMLKRCWQFLTDNYKKIRDCYGQEISISSEAESEDAFKKMMLVDACFILQVLREGTKPEPAASDHRVVHDNDQVNYAPLILAVRRDLVLLENQLPYFVLEGLYTIIFNDPADYNSFRLSALVLEFFSLFKQEPDIARQTMIRSQPLRISHLLDHISRSTFIDKKSTPPPFSTQITTSTGPRYRSSRKVLRRDTVVLRNATELRAAGVQLENRIFTMPANLLDIDFRDGCLSIPSLILNDFTETLFRNLLAYEQVSRRRNSSSKCVASYVFFMSRLIDSKKDLQLLERQGILVNEVGAAEDVVKIFHSISKLVTLDIEDFYFDRLCEKVEKYCNSRWQRYKQDLKQSYFKTPWLTLSLCAATVLLVLTLLQTIYTILSFYHQPPS